MLIFSKNTLLVKVVCFIFERLNKPLPTNQINSTMEVLAKKFQGLFDYLKDRGGECIMICRDSSKTRRSCTAFMAMTPESTASMMAELFDRYPYLLPKALMAAAFSIDDEAVIDDGENAENEGFDPCMN